MRKHFERHYGERIGWLRAAVLGANDGIVSTASLVVGVAAANAARGEVLIAGMAGLVAGAMSMAAGEYVSVSSQADTESADLERERRELEDDEDPSARSSRRSTSEGGSIGSWRSRWPSSSWLTMPWEPTPETSWDSRNSLARPIQAALASASTFAVGAACHCFSPGPVPRPSWSRQWGEARSCSWRCWAEWLRVSAVRAWPSAPVG